MARNRMLNPEFWLDEDIAKLSAHARLLYMGLWGICDDNYATFPNRPEWVKAQVFPYEEVDIRTLLAELSAKGKIILFISDDHHEFFYIKNFFKHQRVERPSKAKYPEFKPDNAVQYTRLVEPSVSPRSEVKLSKEKRSEENILSDAKPSDDAFNKFWEAYPKKEEKKTSRDKWKAKKLDSQLEVILDFIQRAAQTDRWKNGYIKQPTTFISKECWNDDLASYNDKAPPGKAYRNENDNSMLEKLKNKVL